MFKLISETSISSCTLSEKSSSEYHRYSSLLHSVGFQRIQISISIIRTLCNLARVHIFALSDSQNDHAEVNLSLLFAQVGDIRLEKSYLRLICQQKKMEEKTQILVLCCFLTLQFKSDDIMNGFFPSISKKNTFIQILKIFIVLA